MRRPSLSSQKCGIMRRGTQMPNVSTLNQSRGKTRWFDPKTLATLATVIIQVGGGVCKPGSRWAGVSNKRARFPFESDR